MMDKEHDYINLFCNHLLRYNRLFELDAPTKILEDEWKLVKAAKRKINHSSWVTIPECVRECYADNALLIKIFKPNGFRVFKNPHK